MMIEFDVLVIGGGHAGCEAASAAARLGARVALMTMQRETIGAMSCNPAVGGVGKGQLVREVDALDGLIARASDAAAIHYRMLNRSKGKAVQGPRVQADRAAFRAAIQAALAALTNLTIVEGSAESLILSGGVAVGALLADGRRVEARSTVLASGTFLGARMFCGETSSIGGRVGEPAATALAQQLRARDLPVARLKTGTPPRLDGRTIDWSRLDRQPSDVEPWTMSPVGARTLPQVFCAVTRTNSETHRLIREGLARSPLYSGAISASGPRYCPSIEDKVVRFGDRDGHQIFLEPEGCKDRLIYPNGISTSLPPDVQTAMIQSIAGLERAAIVQPGYAVEYDFLDPRALDHGLESRAVPGLFLAGQVNGTTGYEEAAAQGLVAGANAAARALARPPLRLHRDGSYIGVMVDDLVLQGVTEPYRMLTARAEHRLYLRADNAETRLTQIGIAAGIVGAARAERHRARAAHRAIALPSMDGDLSLSIRRGAVDARALKACDSKFAGIPEDLLDELIEDVRYAPYVERQRVEVTARSRAEAVLLRADMDYAGIAGLSAEMVQRFTAARPGNMGEAERIPGVTPAALSALFVHNRLGAGA
ncbi:MAG: tRNA uridine-5-carboxymethylaminomethyl(34) synthesis enzyme MnmG [Sphingomonadaceae bacterium]